jgi:hypothetical protein
MPYNASLAAFGFNNAAFAQNGDAGNLPDGLTLFADGSISGTPANDAVTSSFGVFITDGNTGFTCSATATISVLKPMAINWNDLAWGAPNHLTIPGTGTYNESFVGAVASQNLTGNNNGWVRSNCTGTLVYTGPAQNCNVKCQILVCQARTGADGFFISITDSLGNSYVNQAFFGSMSPGTFNFPFVIPISAGVTYSVYLSSSANGFTDGGPVNNSWVVTLTPAM